ncbi:extracellular protein [Alkalibacterium sp. AK22]|uniref:WxL domain-containing protein n=1 Tax=Alkalibacterium sp. AK22 TaxID=1229520 RepID=UPI0004466D5B|nr:WxL domain-containing protein [Alkalibacterium sp. AK22]EXJ24334.1 extracellular protein [Alkalibacterium sp. AK22]
MSKSYKVVALSAVAALFCSVMTAPAVMADPNEAESDVTIEFIVPDDTDVPTVVDPTDPSITFPVTPGDRDPGDPDDPVTGFSGPLTLDFVSSLDFGTVAISAQSQEYESLTLRPFVQVTDRRGTREGWALTVSLSEFRDEEGETSLSGAVLNLENASLVTPGVGGDNTPEGLAGSIALDSNGTSANVTVAGEGTGAGTWLTRWLAPVGETPNPNVTLTVPGGAATVGDHEATLTWILTNAPE